MQKFAPINNEEKFNNTFAETKLCHYQTLPKSLLLKFYNKFNINLTIYIAAAKWPQDRDTNEWLSEWTGKCETK